MKTLSRISYRNTGYFTGLINDYIERKESVRNFYVNYPDEEGFANQIRIREAQFPEASRKVLHTVIQSQYREIKTSVATRENIAKLQLPHTFTVTTGHQLNLFTGPLYFLYKIITAINLTKHLKAIFPAKEFVPVYWMATEDHDFEEIRFFNFKNRKIEWKKQVSGAVGDCSTDGLQAVFEEFEELLGSGKNAEYLRSLFKRSYLEHPDLTAATRFLANELFKDSGLVIIDANNRELKQLFSSYMKDELLNQTAFREVSRTADELQKSHFVQQPPREINLFYLKKGLRERIIRTKNNYAVNNTAITFTEEEILKELGQFPERFSPNVIMRPLYEEVILPNLCYIGGGGELAYWLQLKRYFEQMQVPYPILLLRNSVLLMSEKQDEKRKKLGVSYPDLFYPKEHFIDKRIREISDIIIDFTKQKEVLKAIFDHLKEVSHCTDPSFTGAVKAQEKKQLKGMDMLEKRLLKAQKRKLEDVVTRLEILHDELFPGGGLQERQLNFSEFYLEAGKNLLKELEELLNPLDMRFDVVGY